MTTTELSAKKALLQSLLRCPHRDLKQTIPVFGQALDRDPLFTGKCLYALTLPKYNRIRDLAESGIAHLLISPYPEHRRAGHILFQGLEPYRAYRAGRFIRGDLKKTNRQVRRAVEQYLVDLELNKQRFDRAVMVAKDDLHHLYEFFHIKPSARAQTILFEHKVPEGEIDLVKILRTSATPEEQASNIVKYKIPYRLATSVLKGLTPAVWVALIEVMTPVEAVNIRAAIEKSGILKDNEIRALYEHKLTQVKGSERVSVQALGERKSAKGTDERLEKIVQEARQEKVDKGSRITVDTLIATDCSGSMKEAIEVAKRLSPMVSAICDAGLEHYCFSDTAWHLDIKGKTIQDYERAYHMVKSNGPTCLGAALRMCIDKGFVPEQAIYITDQGENRSPALVDVYQKLATDGIDIRFVFVTIKGFDVTDKVAKELEQAGADVVDYRMEAMVGESGWYTNLENIVPLLTRGGYLSLVNEIMALELPK